MNNLFRWLTTPKIIPTWASVSFLVVAAIGFADTAFLSVEHYRGAIVPCFIVTGCDIVTTSQYSLILGIPVAYLGLLYYTAMLILTVAYFDKKKSQWLRLAFLGTPFGLAFSLWFLYAQAFLLKAYCLYCLGSIATSTLLFIIAALYFIFKKNNTSQPLPDFTSKTE